MFQFLTDIPSHLAFHEQMGSGDANRVSIPNGHPQPFSLFIVAPIELGIVVSIPNGHPQPFSQ